MLTTAILFLSWFQEGGAASPQKGRPKIECAQCADAGATEEVREAHYEEQEFLRQVNGLLAALTSFSKTYNSGHTVDVKNVKAIRKALRELEKSEWFSRKGN